MTPDIEKRITYDLALEYAKEHRIFSESDSKIQGMVEKFAKISKTFYEEIKNNSTLKELY